MFSWKSIAYMNGFFVVTNLLAAAFFAMPFSYFWTFLQYLMMEACIRFHKEEMNDKG